MRSIETGTRSGRMHALHWPSTAPPGSRPTLVLVHGLGMSSQYMVRAGEALARSGAPVYAPDLPGFGRSERPPRVLGVPELATALANWCDAQSIGGGAVFIGHSLGCQVVVELARRWPERAAALVLAAPTVDPAARSVLRQIGRLLPDLAREPLSLGPLVAGAYLRAGLGRVLRTLSLMVRDPTEAKLPLLLVPALVLQGERDGVVPPAWSTRVAALLPRGSYAVVAGAGHGFVYSKPLAVARAIETFLRLNAIDLPGD